MTDELTVLASSIPCELCPALVASRNRIVEAARGTLTWSAGPARVDVRILFVGEAPGEDEDRQGVPFVGSSGKLLRDAIAQAGADPKYLAFTNAVRCRPVDNRTPSSQEIKECSGWLAGDILRLRPQLIVGLGQVAQKSLADLGVGCRSLMHPAYVLRQPRFREQFFVAIYDVCREAGVSTLPLNARAGGAPPPFPEPYKLVGSVVQSAVQADELRWLAADTETTGEDDGDTVGWSLATPSFTRFYGTPPSLGSSGWKHVYLHGAKFDLPRFGIDPSDLSRWDCTMVMAYILRYPEVGLGPLGRRLTGLSKRSYPDLMKATRVAAKAQGVKLPVGIKDFREALKWIPDEASEYGAMDPLITSRLAKTLTAELEKEPILKKYYYEIEKPTLPILYEMEQNGVYIDESAVRPIEAELMQMEADATDILRSLSGDGDFNPFSPKQVIRALDRLVDKWPRADYTTDKATLLRIAGYETYDQLDEAVGGPVNQRTFDVKLLFPYWELRARQARKYRTTYVERLYQTQQGGRLHGEFNQCVTATNRLSSSNPNLQNIPNRTELGRRIRRAFAVPPGKVLARYDFSQLEVRVFAHYTRATVLMDAYWAEAQKEVDIHDMVRQALGLPPGKKYRDMAKNANFALMYGAEERKFSETAGVSLEQGREFIGLYRERIPELLRWREQVAEALGNLGYLESLFGWRMYFPAWWSPVWSEKSEAGRQATNGPIQGSAAGIMKLWTLRAADIWRRFGAIPILQVHDEMVFEVEPSAEPEMTKLLVAAARDLGGDYGLAVPLRLSPSVGPNWSDCVDK